MNKASAIEFAQSAVVLNINDMRNYAVNKVAKTQGPNDQEENALWADFIDCLQEATKAAANIEIQDLTQEEVECIK